MALPLPEIKKNTCRGCEHFVEEYNYSVCIRDKEKPLILPNDEGWCVERINQKDIDNAINYWKSALDS